MLVYYNTINFCSVSTRLSFCNDLSSFFPPICLLVTIKTHDEWINISLRNDGHQENTSSGSPSTDRKLMVIKPSSLRNLRPSGIVVRGHGRLSAILILYSMRRIRTMRASTDATWRYSAGSSTDSSFATCIFTAGSIPGATDATTWRWSNLMIGVCLRRSKARTPYVYKRSKERSEGVNVKIEDLFVI
jgi:hypothetical protein